MICTKRHRGREGRLCQTDGTPCCVFDWKRKVTFAATSKRQWSAKQIGLRSAALLEQTLLQGTSEVVFHNNAVCASQLSEVKGDVPLSSLQGEQKPLLRYTAMHSTKAAEKPRQWAWGFFSSLFFFPLGHLQIIFRDGPAGFPFGVSGVQVSEWIKLQCGLREMGRQCQIICEGCHWRRRRLCVAGEAYACTLPAVQTSNVAEEGCVGGFPPLFFFFFWAHLSWQPYSASVKTRYRNVLWVTFKTRYKSSALWDCSAINYLA